MLNPKIKALAITGFHGSMIFVIIVELTEFLKLVLGCGELFVAICVLFFFAWVYAMIKTYPYILKRITILKEGESVFI